MPLEYYVLNVPAKVDGSQEQVAITHPSCIEGDGVMGCPRIHQGSANGTLTPLTNDDPWSAATWQATQTVAGLTW